MALLRKLLVIIPLNVIAILTCQQQNHLSYRIVFVIASLMHRFKFGLNMSQRHIKYKSNTTISCI